jgi:hypothetical protein
MRMTPFTYSFFCPHLILTVVHSLSFRFSSSNL